MILDIITALWFVIKVSCLISTFVLAALFTYGSYLGWQERRMVSPRPTKGQEGRDG